MSRTNWFQRPQDRRIPHGGEILAEAVDRKPCGTLKIYLQGFGSHVVCAIQAEGTPYGPCDTQSCPDTESLEIADLRTRIESCSGKFSLYRHYDGIRIWSSWPLPSREPSLPIVHSLRRPHSETVSRA